MSLRDKLRETIDDGLNPLLRTLETWPLYQSRDIRLAEYSDAECESWLSAVLAGGRLALHVTELGEGGTERCVRDLAMGYAHKGLNPLLLVDHDASRIGHDRLVSSGVDIHYLGVDPKVNRLAYMQRLGEVLGEYRIRLLHRNTWLRNDWIESACVQHGIMHVKTFHCTMQASSRWLLGWVAPGENIWLHRWKARQTRPAFICISDKSAHALRMYWGKYARITRVYVGVPVDNVLPPLQTSGPLTFAWVGSFIPRKRPMNMLATFAQLAAKISDVSLVMMGDGPLLHECKEYAGEHLAGKVEFTGFVPDVSRRLAEADVFVMTSSNEGLPYVVLEAMAMSRPVIANDCGAMREAVQDGTTGFIVGLNDDPGLINAMEKLARDRELLARMGAAGHRRVEKVFSLPRMVHETLRAYAVMLQGFQTDIRIRE